MLSGWQMVWVTAAHPLAVARELGPAAPDGPADSQHRASRSSAPAPAAIAGFDLWFSFSAAQLAVSGKAY